MSSVKMKLCMLIVTMEFVCVLSNLLSEMQNLKISSTLNSDNVTHSGGLVLKSGQNSPSKQKFVHSQL